MTMIPTCKTTLLATALLLLISLSNGLLLSHDPMNRALTYPNYATTRSSLCATIHHDREDEERLLLTEPALTAYVQAEVQAWLFENTSRDGALVERTAAEISVALKTAYQLASLQGILSNHGALITFLTNELRETHPLPFQKYAMFHTTPLGVAKQCVDVLHHRLYRGTYTKTTAPTGAGDMAAREAVGLPPMQKEELDQDNCLVEPPPELIDADCLWTERDQAEWQDRRFEKITMEGWRDPRRGNSGTSR